MMPSPIKPKEYGYKVDWGQICSMPVNLSLVLVCKLIFADNTDSLAYNHQDAQEILIRCSKYAKVFELKINLKKMEVMYQPPP